MNKRRKIILKLWKPIALVLLSFFLLPPHLALATHYDPPILDADGIGIRRPTQSPIDPAVFYTDPPPVDRLENPCNRINDPFLFEPLELPPLDVPPGDGAGEVPVFDDDVVIVVNNLQRMMLRMIEFAQSEELESRKHTQTLWHLCRKEFQEDHTNQHAWREAIDAFVLQTYDFVVTGYAGNPIFLQNHSVYNQLVDDEVLITFLQEIMVSNIGITAQRRIVKNLLKNRFEQVFPFNTIGAPGYNPDIQLAPEGLPDALRDEFIALGGLDAVRKLAQPGNSVEQTIAMAEAEFERRKSERSDFENQKLDWGRGFFSYEYCNYGDGNGDGLDELGLFSDITADRRNCYIVTPGSLIQDQVSNVFGSAIRQMELNDEYEEWIGQSSFEVLASTLSRIGLNARLPVAFADEYVPPLDRDPTPRVVSSHVIQEQIERVTSPDGDIWNQFPDGTGPPEGILLQLIPEEFFNLDGDGVYVDPVESTKIDRDNELIRRIEFLFDNGPLSPLLN